MKVIFVRNEAVNYFHERIIFNEGSFFCDGEDGLEFHSLIVKINNFMFENHFNGID
jgi:hypothetical protein